METDSQMNFTVGEILGGKGNVVLNTQFESMGQVFYDQANDELTTNQGFSSEILLIQATNVCCCSTVYPLTLPESWHLVKQMLKVNVFW